MLFEEDVEWKGAVLLEKGEGVIVQRSRKEACIGIRHM
jgi:hypothetical protein